MGGVGKTLNKVHSVVSKLDPAIKAGDKVATKLGLPTIDSLTAEPEVPELDQTTVIPTEDSDAIAAARRRKTAEQMSRSGRQSTILSDRLGG